MDSTVDQRRQVFSDNGYVTYRQFFAGEQFEELMANVSRLLDSDLPSIPSEHLFFEDKQDPTTRQRFTLTCGRGERFSDCDAGFPRVRPSTAFRGLT